MGDGAQSIGIVGAGIIGINCALSLLEAGHSVTMFDRDEPGQATSFGNAGVISPWSIVPQAMPGIWKSLPGMLLRRDGPASVQWRHAPRYIDWLARFLRESGLPRAQANSDAMRLLCDGSVELYRQHLKGTGHEDLVTDAMYVHLYRTEAAADLEAHGHRMRRDAGAVLEKIGANDLRDLEPAISPDYAAAVLIKGQARARNPGKIGEVLAEKVARLGGQIRRTAVESIRPADRKWMITTSDGAFGYEKVVLSAGVWSARLLAELGIKVPLAVERGYHVSYPDSGIELNNSILDTEAHVVASSMEPGLRVAGIAEFAGEDSEANQALSRVVQRMAERLIPGLARQTPDVWMGARPSFPDSLPLVEELAKHPGLIAAFGHSHYGLMMAPQTGRLVSNIVRGAVPNADYSVFGLDRF